MFMNELFHVHLSIIDCKINKSAIFKALFKYKNHDSYLNGVLRYLASFVKRRVKMFNKGNNRIEVNLRIRA